jgi:hypothetical protein
MNEVLIVKVRQLLWLTAFAIIVYSVNSLADNKPEVESAAKKIWPPLVGLSEAQCGPLKMYGRHGPYDYRNPPPEAIIDNVEFNHFNGHYKAMKQGKEEYFGPGGGRVAAGFGYTLHAFPNHHRALMAMEEYSRRKGFMERPPGAERSVECYFERAIRFRPDDVVVRYLYAYYLDGRKRKKEADRQLELIESEVERRPQLAYNIGLLYADRGDYIKALRFAGYAYGQGYDLPGLKAKLVAQGVWDDISMNISERSASTEVNTDQEQGAEK